MQNKSIQFKIKESVEWRYPALVLKALGFKWKDSGLAPQTVPFAKIINGNRQVIIHIDLENKTIDRGYNFNAFGGNIVSRKTAIKQLRLMERSILNESIRSITGDSTGGSTDND